MFWRPQSVDERDEFVAARLASAVRLASAARLAASAAQLDLATVSASAARLDLSAARRFAPLPYLHRAVAPLG